MLCSFFALDSDTDFKCELTGAINSLNVDPTRIRIRNPEGNTERKKTKQKMRSPSLLPEGVYGWHQHRISVELPVKRYGTSSKKANFKRVNPCLVFLHKDILSFFGKFYHRSHSGIHSDRQCFGSGSGSVLAIRIRIKDSQNGVQTKRKKIWDFKLKRALTILLKAWWFFLSLEVLNRSIYDNLWLNFFFFSRKKKSLILVMKKPGSKFGSVLRSIRIRNTADRVTTLGPEAYPARPIVYFAHLGPCPSRPGKCSARPGANTARPASFFDTARPIPEPPCPTSFYARPTPTLPVLQSLLLSVSNHLISRNMFWLQRRDPPFSQKSNLFCFKKKEPPCVYQKRNLPCFPEKSTICF